MCVLHRVNFFVFVMVLFLTSPLVKPADNTTAGSAPKNCTSDSDCAPDDSPLVKSADNTTAGKADQNCTSDSDCAPDTDSINYPGIEVTYKCGIEPKQFYTFMTNNKTNHTTRVLDPEKNYTVCECDTFNGQNASLMYFEDQELLNNTEPKTCGIADGQACLPLDKTNKTARGCASWECITKTNKCGETSKLPYMASPSRTERLFPKLTILVVLITNHIFAFTDLK